MEAASAVRNRSQGRRSQYDNELIKAKREKRPVGLVLAVQTHYTDDEGYVAAKVCHVDTYSVKFEIKGREQWISKAFIVSVGDPE